MSKFLAWLKGELSVLDDKLNTKAIYYEVHGYFPEIISENMYPDYKVEVYKFPDMYMAIQQLEYIKSLGVRGAMYEVTEKSDRKHYKEL